MSQPKINEGPLESMERPWALEVLRPQGTLRSNEYEESTPRPRETLRRKRRTTSGTLRARDNHSEYWSERSGLNSGRTRDGWHKPSR